MSKKYNNYKNNYRNNNYESKENIPEVNKKNVDDMTIEELREEVKTLNKKLTVLIQCGQITYNEGGTHRYSPSEIMYRITEENLKSDILSFSQRTIKDFQQCTVSIDNRSGILNVYLWLPSDSEHLIDKSHQNNDSIIGNKTIYKYSDKMKSFMDSYCRPEHRRTYSEEAGMRLSAIQVQIDKMYAQIFDENGKAFQYEFSQSKYNQSSVFLQLEFNRRKSDDFSGASLKCLNIIKKSKMSGNRTPIPKSSYHIN